MHTDNIVRPLFAATTIFALVFAILPLSAYADELQADTDPVETAAAPLVFDSTFTSAQSLTNSLVASFTRTSEGSAPDASLVEIARSRANLMRQLARTNPEAFLSTALPESQRSRFSADVQQYLEIEFDSNGTINVVHVDDFKNPKNSYFKYTFVVNGSNFDLKQAGGTLPLVSDTQVHVSGYRIGESIVAYAGNRGLTVVAPAAAQETGSTGRQKTLVVLLHDASDPLPPYPKADMHNIIFNSSLQQFYKTQSYGNVSFTGTTTDWIGITPFQHDAGACDFSYIDVTRAEISNYLVANSINPRQYARTLFMIYDSLGGCSTVGQEKLSWQGRSYYSSLSWSGMPSVAQSLDYVGRLNGVIFEEAHVPEDVAFSRCAGKAKANPDGQVNCTWGAQTIFNTADNLNYEKNFAMSRSYFAHVTAHELGHALGVMHANAWICSGASFNTPDCRHEEYGNWADTMGYGLYGANFNAFYKDFLGWVASSSKTVVSTTGKVKLFPISGKNGVSVVEVLNPALAGSSAAHKSVYLELRSPIGFDYLVSGGWAGVHINQANDSTRGLQLPFARLLNGQQSTKPDFSSPALQSGMNFNYPSHGIKLSNANIAAAAATLKVTISTPECKTFPLQTVSYGSRLVTPGGDLFFTVGFTNMNYPACGDSRVKFLRSNAADFGWTMDFVSPKTALTIPTGDIDYYFFNFKIPNDMTPGTYTLRIWAKDTTFGKVYKYSFPVTVE